MSNGQAGSVAAGIADEGVEAVGAGGWKGQQTDLPGLPLLRLRSWRWTELKRRIHFPLASRAVSDRLR